MREVDARLEPALTTRRGESYCGDLHDVLPALGKEWAHLIWFDGPYGMNKAEWDRFSNLAALVDWYRRPLALLTEAAAPSASVYLWGTDETEATLRDPMRALGWTYRGRVTWQKTGAHPALIGARNANTWADTTEVAGFYQRGTPYFNNREGISGIWPLNPTADLQAERLYSEEMGVHKVHGTPIRCAAHPCQKPLAFARRAILASSRSGETVLDLCAGTHRIAVACERLPESEARRHVSIEYDPQWVERVRPLLMSAPEATATEAQPSLFGGAL